MRPEQHRFVTVRGIASNDGDNVEEGAGRELTRPFHVGRNIRTEGPR